MLGNKTEKMGYRNIGYRNIEYRSPVTLSPPLENVVPTCAKNSATRHKTTQWLEYTKLIVYRF